MRNRIHSITAKIVKPRAMLANQSTEILKEQAAFQSKSPYRTYTDRRQRVIIKSNRCQVSVGTKTSPVMPPTPTMVKA